MIIHFKDLSHKYLIKGSNYDFHLLLNILSQFPDIISSPKVIARSFQKFVSIDIGDIVFKV